MSRAFIKEDVDLPERSGRKRSASGLPPGATNYITARGAKRLRNELQELRAANALSERVTELEQIGAKAMGSDLKTFDIRVATAVARRWHILNRRCRSTL